MLKRIEKYLDNNLKPEQPINKNLKGTKLSDFVRSYISEVISRFKDKAIKEIIVSKSKRSIENVEIITKDNQIYKLSIKTFDSNGVIPVPGIISINRVLSSIGEPTNHLIYVLVDYHESQNVLYIKNPRVKRVEDFDIRSLKVQHLGNGQLQFMNPNNIRYNESVSREEWLTSFKKICLGFYDKLITDMEKKRKKYL